MTIAAIHNVFGGACSVWWGVSAGTVKEIGFSVDGVVMRIDPKWGDILSDDYGGAGGVPSDSQFLGATATLTADMPKYVAANTDELSSFLSTAPTGTKGVLAPIGTLVRSSVIDGVLVLTDGVDGATPVTGDHVITFPVAFLRVAQEVNKGTKFSTYIAGWEAWVDESTKTILYTDVITA